MSMVHARDAAESRVDFREALGLEGFSHGRLLRGSTKIDQIHIIGVAARQDLLLDLWQSVVHLADWLHFLGLAR